MDNFPTSSWDQTVGLTIRCSEPGHRVAVAVGRNGDWGQACDLRFSVTRHFVLLKDLGVAALESQNRKPDPGFGSSAIGRSVAAILGKSKP